MGHRPKHAKTGADDTATLTAIVVSEAAPESALLREWMLIAMSGASVGRIYPLSRQRPITVLGREDMVDVVIVDAEISRRHAAIRYDAAAGTFHLNDLDSRNGTWLNGERCHTEMRLSVGDKIRLGASAVLRVSHAAEAEAAYAKQMYQAVLRDALTGAFNRRYLDERLESELAFCKRHRIPLSVLFLDLDHFKAVNDTHGHSAGDAALVHVCAILQKQVRSEDVVGRYGGEEFAVVCRQTDEARAAVLGERLRFAVEKGRLALPNGELALTVSVGIAGIPRDGIDTVQKLVDAADDALYEAKRLGRNRVCISG
jgi:two-component system, cell cycle response regulator